MPMTILEDCTSCNACEEECPTGAIRAGDDLFVVDAAACTDCVGEHPAPRCVEVCPVDGCIVPASAQAA